MDLASDEKATITPEIAAAVSRVRLATWDDEPELLAQCKRLHEENGLMEMSEDKVRAMLHRCFRRQGGIVGVIGPKGAIEASIALVIGQVWYSDEWCIEELYNHVLPEHRRSTNAKDLITFAKYIADDVGLPLLIGVLSNERTAAKIRLYERQFGPASGGFFVHGRRTGHWSGGAAHATAG